MSAHRILVVDDNELNVQLAAFVLDQAGFEVQGSADALQARD